MNMPPLAHRLTTIEPFKAMALHRRAFEMQASGRPVIHMSLGEPDFPAPPRVRQRLEELLREGGAGYTPATGIAPLREAIAAHYRDVHGVEVSPSQVVVTAGGTGALVLACALTLDAGTEVLMPDPTYPCNRHIVSAFDARTRLIPSGPAKRFQMDAADIDTHWGPTTRAALLASPSNPTGTTIEPAALQALHQAIRRKGGWLIFDEIYNGLTYDAARPRTALTLGDDVLVVNSFSKTYAMTGWRLGWLVVPEALAPHAEKLSMNLYICPSALAQYAALACFEPESLAQAEAQRVEFGRRRDFLVPALRRLGVQVPVVPDGAFYVWGDVSGFGRHTEALAAHLLDHAEVSLVPGTDFGVHEADRWMRFTYSTSMDKLEEAMQRIERALARL